MQLLGLLNCSQILFLEIHFQHWTLLRKREFFFKIGSKITALMLNVKNKIELKIVGWL